MSEFNRQVGFYENHFKDFYLKQPIAVRKKIDWTLLVLKTTRIVPEKFLKHLTNTDGHGKCEFQQEKEFSESSVFLMMEI